MLLGIRLKASPTPQQKNILSQWMGCSKYIWNAKCEEARYYNTYAKKYFPMGTYAPIDQKYSQFKNKELSPWLYQVPSQILRNSASNWYDTYKKFIQGICGKPKRKHKSDAGSVHLTKELFNFKKDEDGVVRLYIGTKKHNLGFLAIKNHRAYKSPNSIYIKKNHGKYSVSFCYEDGHKIDANQKQHLEYLKTKETAFLQKYVVGIDRGVAIPVQCNNASFDFTSSQKEHKRMKSIKLKRYQRKMARQQKGANQQNKTKRKIAACYQKISNIRTDFCHKTSHSIVTNPENKIIILEDLKTINMTKKPKAKQISERKWEKNRARAKAGLNKSILDKCWHKLETFIKYKSEKNGKAWFKVSAQYTSLECANCGHTHPDNRKSQSKFICECCGNSKNADLNAAMVIKKKAIKLILNSGTELSKRGVLLDIGRGAKCKPQLTNVNCASGIDTSKKKRTAAADKVVA